MIGIYKIINILNNKVYIGKSSFNIKHRWNQHKTKLRHNKHDSKYLQNSWNKHGEDCFKFEIIEKCSLDAIDDREVYWIDFYKSTDREYGYNTTIGGTGGNTIEFKTKKEQLDIKEKQRKSSIGKNNKLSEQQVIEIKSKIVDGLNNQELASLYNVDSSTISKIRNLKNWDWLCSELNSEIAKTQSIKSKTRVDYDKDMLIKLHTEGKSCTYISNLLGIHHSTVLRYIKKVEQADTEITIESKESIAL